MAALDLALGKARSDSQSITLVQTEISEQLLEWIAVKDQSLHLFCEYLNICVMD